VILLHELIGIGLYNGAIHPIVIHYTLDSEFDWSGEIQLVPDRRDAATHPDLLVAEIEAVTGIAEHEDDERD
jgi:hypothetical protein